MMLRLFKTVFCLKAIAMFLILETFCVFTSHVFLEGTEMGGSEFWGFEPEENHMHKE